MCGVGACIGRFVGRHRAGFAGAVAEAGPCNRLDSGDTMEHFSASPIRLSNCETAVPSLFVINNKIKGVSPVALREVGKRAVDMGRIEADETSHRMKQDLRYRRAV